MGKIMDKNVLPTVNALQQVVRQLVVVQKEKVLDAQNVIKRVIVNHVNWDIAFLHRLIIVNVTLAIGLTKMEITL